ncbi:hypothetical protein [Legionella sp. 16cNR16C]|uniref:hypothetical protein n=1 Tax=Legionella sp. 16cNR16C TaxID=2905656 RepID=UPI001E2ABBCD|nr:hypothetical protein [Legionella sp. 16cNR16C]MCE3046338.1 hypothetical protein [Legionella sp. 16cNR16C]
MSQIINNNRFQPLYLSHFYKTILAKLPYLFLSLYCLVLISGIFLPLYPDEVVTKWTTARFFEESGKTLSLFSQCQKSTGVAISWVFYPAALVYSIMYKQLLPLGLRISGLVIGFLWLSGIAYWCFKSIKPRLNAAYFLAALIAASLALGVMPYNFIMARSEQPLIFIILLCFLYCLFWKNSFSARMQCLAGLIFVVLASCFFYIHPKSIFFLPFMMTVAYYISDKGPRALQVLLVLIPVVLAYKTFQIANLMANCEETPLLNSILGSNTLSPALLWESPLAFFQEGLLNLKDVPSKIVNHLVFQPYYQSSWLPSAEVSGVAAQGLNLGIKTLLYLLIIGSHLGALGLFIYCLLKRLVTMPILLGGVLALGSLGSWFFTRIWNFYGASQLLPLSLMLILSLPLAALQKRFVSRFNSVSIILILFASLSMAILVRNYLPVLILNSKSTTADISGQYLSIPVFGASQHIKTLNELAKECKLPSENVKNLVVDHMTYFAFKNVPNPIHVLYVSESVYGQDLTNGRLKPFLSKIDSPGLIIRCSYLPPQLGELPRSEKNGYCCINLQQLSKVDS